MKQGRWFSLLAAGCLLILAVPHTERTSFAQADLQAQTVTTGEVKQLKVATYNIHIGKDAENNLNLEETIQALQATGADIIGLQEVERHSPRSKFEDQPRLISEALGLNYHFESALTVGPFEFGNVLLSRYPILATERIELKSRKEDRVALLATLQVQGQALRVLVTHLGLVQQERARDVAELNKRLQATDGPVLVLGDFNTNEQAAELQPWLQQFPPTTPQPVETFPGSGEQIDYVLASKHFQSTNSYTVPSPASDHLPLVSVLDWQR
ncbi:endonuclease/exonuclease/phosphatase family protein [Tumebacillus permanentifrigoris]|uniref:Endonuclease/exonuclease/phosphatase family metal-dependent hydrolase n=1 Tax=Tumebacillus permanentifrigoris TaxID=378543 RepID=A0A316DAX0_9BACL|nr:endonuclease/exonuclease/phosphatase family protein [Tumebacillus permanentifrigoris]PWK14478.1 endonuclease/exonuclease/phosphatase family metal-dependent hydrolase [Tumebacillus permanentifrigoris]